MNRHVAWTLTLVAGAWVGESTSAQTTTPPASQRKAGAQAAPAVDPAAQQAAAVAKVQQQARQALAMEPILLQWEKQSAKTTSLDAVFDMVERSPGFGDTYYRCRALLQAPDKALLEYKKYILGPDGKPLVQVDKNGKPKANLEKEPEKWLICTGTEVLQYTWANKVINVFPLQKNIQQKALQEGPLPFLFNMKAEEAKQRYGMWLNTEFQDEYVIDIAPRNELDRDAFQQARVWLNKKTFLPNQIWLVKNGGKEREEYKLNGANDMVVMNPKWNQDHFKFQTFQGWKTVVNKDAANAAAPPAVQGQPKQQTAQPGMRPQPR
jgi:TIGR03009 family protein